jgi:hypothetical protein
MAELSDEFNELSDQAEKLTISIQHILSSIADEKL